MNDCAEIVIAFVSLCAAIYALWQSSRIAKQQLRAYLGVSFRWRDGELDCNMGLNETDNSTGIFVRNFGQTPAFDVCFRATTAILPPSPSDNDITQVLKLVETEPPRTCNPGGLPLYFPVQYSGPAESLSSGASVYAVGSISYKDAFQKHRITEFCLYWDDEFRARTGGGWVHATVFNRAT